MARWPRTPVEPSEAAAPVTGRRVRLGGSLDHEADHNRSALHHDPDPGLSSVVRSGEGRRRGRGRGGQLVPGTCSRAAVFLRQQGPLATDAARLDDDLVYPAYAVTAGLAGAFTVIRPATRVLTSLRIGRTALPPGWPSRPARRDRCRVGRRQPEQRGRGDLVHRLSARHRPTCSAELAGPAWAHPHRRHAPHPSRPRPRAPLGQRSVGSAS